MAGIRKSFWQGTRLALVWARALTFQPSTLTKFPTQKQAASSSYTEFPILVPAHNHGSSCPEMGEGRGSQCNPEESGPPQQKTPENFGGYRNIRTRCHCLSDSSLGVNKQQWYCTAEAMTGTGGVVEPRKIHLTFYFVQDTKLSSGSAAGCVGLMNVS